jgi:transcriptional regulator with XRE-family HTH domain
MFIIEPKLFASNLRYYRERQSFTVQHLAASTGVPYSTIVALEEGVRVPIDDHLRRIATALGVKAEELILPRKFEPEDYETC